MKNIKLLMTVLVCLFIVNVKADMGAPYVVTHKVKVTNKNGAACYEDGKKTGKVIPYGTTLDLYDDINGSYIYVSGDEYSCNVKYSDISAVNQNFSLNNESVSKLSPTIKAIVLAKGGLNMRKGPAVSYSKITTVPQYSVITLTYSAGSFWYYTTYNGKSGWITGMDGYLGFEGKEILINSNSVKIYSTNGKTVLGTIPAKTGIDEYLELSGSPYNEFSYYVIYNGIKGYIKDNMWHKVDGIGKIKLTKDYILDYDDNGNPSKKIAAGTELEYDMMDGDGTNTVGFNIPSRNTAIYALDFKYVKEAKIVTKTEGYLGEGLYGEAKTTKEEIPTEPEPKVEDPIIDEPVIPNEEKKDITNIIIIGLLAGIFACLTALVIIKLVNSKKKAPIVVKEKVVEEPVKKDNSIKVTDKEIAEAREKIIREMQEENKLQKKDNNKEE